MTKTACVTGGNGYIASALIKMLLEKGYAVKTTVRNPDDMEKNSHFKGLQELGPLSVFRADLDEEGSFDDAIAGCDYAFLVAAPVNLMAEDPEVHNKPVTTNLRCHIPSHIRDGTDRSSHRPGGTACPRCSWRRRRPGSRAEHGISLVTVCPVITAGAAPATRVRTSVIDSLSLLSGDEKGLAVLKGIERTSGAVQLVHVDDLCRAELFVAEEAAAAGRYLCSGLNTTVVELARFLSRKYPQYNVKTDFTDDDQLLEKPRVVLSSAKLAREGFEFRYTTLDEIYDDVVEYGKALGILPY
ncbi:hypothetical protein HU200_064344 [Digitaria exilis]|uniref:NmrA-like domain-containing protein n=1 Tax=Digitaria exilis TaxID=1010633 RepID=A0A835A5V2_9POAL|nr:hypothetical protein HU200_064344 [Digitaria exilis]